MSHKRELTARFRKRFSPATAIEIDLRLPIDRFSITVLFGPSGCGKTTTLRCLAGLERPDEGHILFADNVWFDAPSKTCLSPQRRNIGYLFQEYALFPHLSVAGNIAYGLKGIARTERQQRVTEMLERFGLRGLENRYPRQLSGGEQQRVALARVLVRRPQLLLLDEPLSALDGRTRARLRCEVPRLLANFGIPVVLVTHDPAEATALADHLVVLERGRIVQQGTPTDLFAHPVNLAVARIVGMDTVLAGEVVAIADGLTTVAVGQTLLHAACTDRKARMVHVCIRAEAVGLSAAEEQQGFTNGTNRLPARITNVTAEGSFVRVGLDCGFPLLARLMWREWIRLRIGEHMPAIATVDPVNVHVIAADTPDGLAEPSP